MNEIEIRDITKTLKKLRGHMHTGDVDGRLFRAWLRIKAAGELVEELLREQEEAQK